jgi:putative SOS response-associated peptidase YedK
MSWGFPKWDGKGVIINAKSETVREKKMFSKPFDGQRCVIPSTGFYEWRAADGLKEKFRFNAAGSKMLYMAGVFSDGGFVILTRAANEFVSDVHNRMPVVLYKNELARWLADVDFAESILKRDSVALVREAVS